MSPTAQTSHTDFRLCLQLFPPCSKLHRRDNRSNNKSAINPGYGRTVVGKDQGLEIIEISQSVHNHPHPYTHPHSEYQSIILFILRTQPSSSDISPFFHDTYTFSPLNNPHKSLPLPSQDHQHQHVFLRKEKTPWCT